MRLFCFAVFWLFQSFAGTALAERSLVDVIGKPASIAMFNPPIGVLDKVIELDDDGDYLSRSDVWKPLLDNDALVFFMQNPNDVEQLPNIAQRVLSISAVPNDILRVRRDIDIAGRTHLFAFYFLDNFIPFDGSGRTECILGTNIYAMLSGTSDSEYETLVSLCMNT